MSESTINCAGPAPSGARLRVLFLADGLGGGGSERQLCLVLEHLDRRVWAPTVLVYHPDAPEDSTAGVKKLGTEIIEMGAGRGNPLAKLAFTARIARRIKPHVIHSWSVHDNAYAGIVGRMLGTRVRWGSLRGSMALDGFKGLPRWYRWFTIRAVQTVVVNSAPLAAELQEMGLTDDHVFLLPNCVRSESRATKPIGLEEFGFAAGDRVFGNVANIRRVKNQISLARALAIVSAQHPEVRGVIVGGISPGEEPTAETLQQEIRRLGLEGKFVLAGYRHDARSMMKCFSALCLTSLSEGMPNVVLEAMAAGVPVIASAVGGVPGVIVNGETGLLVLPGDVAALAAAIIRVLDDESAARAMTERARAYVKRERSCATVAHRLGQAYLRALGVQP